MACRAAPKSISTTVPSGRTITLPGLMSRCSSPAACTSARPSVSAASTSRTRASGNGPASAASAASVRPSTYSVTM